jgi:hypothetical protein
MHPIPTLFPILYTNSMMSSPDVLLIFCCRRQENRRVQFPVCSSREAVSTSSTHSSSSPYRGAALSRQGSLPAARGTVNPGLGVLRGRKGGVGVGATKESWMVHHILATRTAVIGGWKRLAVACCCSMEAVWSGGGGVAAFAAVDPAAVAAVDPAGRQQER